MAQLELFRISLVKRDPNLFTSLPDYELPEREDYLREVFERRHTFTHYNTVFDYVPTEERALGRAGIVIGQVGRGFVADENKPPEEGFEPTEHVAWKAAALAIDPRKSKDGQRIAMSVDRKVGAPWPILASLARHVNGNLVAPFHIEIEPIFDSGSFWAFAEENKGDITVLSFEFVTPNMFRTEAEIEADLRSFRDEEGAQKVEMKIQTDDGVKTNTLRVKESVAYAEKGCGVVRAKTRKGRHYNSKKNVTRITLDGLDDRLTIVERLIRMVPGIFTEK